MMQDTDLEDTSLGFVQLFTSSLIRFEMSLLFLVILILELKAFILLIKMATFQNDCLIQGSKI